MESKQEGLHPLFDVILQNYFAAISLTDADKKEIVKQLNDEDRKMPTWLRAHLMEQVKEVAN